MSDGNAADDLTFEATVPMTHDALVAHVLRRCGTIWGQPSRVGPVAAWKTEAGFRLRRVGLFRTPGWISLEVEVQDHGGSCRIAGRFIFDDGWPAPRMLVGVIAGAQACVAAVVIVQGLWLGALNPGGFLFFALFAAAGIGGIVSVLRAPRHAAANRAFLIERLEGMIGVPVTVRAGGAAP
ncbi:hypothetical protein [Roseomonas fluvialis]|uniref:Uncharacterized protein n=1 Tax=Roseomonas fluvialis TaxID=1750527 RepID=A0ABN6P2L4_9PROT|nr:hypothetical protein [Roseomonas fluvialis]BDG72894.1 hypothetical protein Rmf_28230 [Roseomonas fluvialis]